MFHVEDSSLLDVEYFNIEWHQTHNTMMMVMNRSRTEWERFLHVLFIKTLNCILTVTPGPERRCFTSKLSVGIWRCVIYCELEDRQCLTELLTTQVWTTTRVGSKLYSHRDTSSGPRRQELGDKSIFKDQTIHCFVSSALSFIYCSQGFPNLSLNQIFFHFKIEISTIKIS